MRLLAGQEGEASGKTKESLVMSWSPSRKMRKARSPSARKLSTLPMRATWRRTAPGGAAPVSRRRACGQLGAAAPCCPRGRAARSPSASARRTYVRRHRPSGEPRGRPGRHASQPPPALDRPPRPPPRRAGSNRVAPAWAHRHPGGGGPRAGRRPVPRGCPRRRLASIHAAAPACLAPSPVRRLLLGPGGREGAVSFLPAEKRKVVRFRPFHVAPAAERPRRGGREDDA